MAKESLEPYFEDIEKELKAIYERANSARQRGFDPKREVDIPCARNMAERVEGLISAAAPNIMGKGIPERITELEKKYGSLDWRISLVIAEEIAREKFCKFNSLKEAMEIGLRVGFAYHTLGTVSSPLEGFIDLDIKKRKDGKEYISLNYAGPIRSAGGTGASVSVLIGDYLRKKFGFATYDATPEEIKRAVTEVVDYHERVANLQYFPSEAEIAFMAERLPVQIDGPDSSNILVSNFRDQPRIASNCIRGGFALVMAECLSQKATKLWKNISKWAKDFDMEHWVFLEEFLKIQKAAKAMGSKKEAGEGGGPKITPDFTYIKDIVAGRPVLSHPMQKGGFRLRYGRCRLSGYSAVSINPATMIALNGMIGIGTQLKMERPGKGATVTPCTNVEGPIVKLIDGSVLQLTTVEVAKRHRKDIAEIIHLGDILISYGDFFNRGHPLIPAGYCEEWWVHELEKAIVGMFGTLDEEKVAEFTGLEPEQVRAAIKQPRSAPIEVCFALSTHLNIPLHPAFTYYWDELSIDSFKQILEWFKEGRLIAGENGPEKFVLPLREPEKRGLELIGIPHLVASNEFVVIAREQTKCLLGLKLIPQAYVPLDAGSTLEAVNKISGICLRDKGGFYIGARMGRPEKGKLRKLKGSPHVLFPVGDEGGRMRSFQAALETGYVNGEFPIYYCKKCKKETINSICEDCGSETIKLVYCKKCQKAVVKCEQHPDQCIPYREIKFDLRGYFKAVLRQLGMSAYPDLIKGVRGTSNKDHVPEHLAKGILRAKHNLTVNKDGTIRFDMTQLPITHFRPVEIGTSIETLKRCGYTVDTYGNPLVNETQVVELRPQDIILPRCIGSSEEGADKIFLRTAQFIDDLLKTFYKLKPYYNIKTADDLIGHLVLMLAPHTSAGIVGRIIGFSNTQALFAHPMLHAATRRDCDGDEACAMLLLDTLINFSRAYLPAHRGSTQDAPLVLVSRLRPTEIDDMVLDLDIAPNYPLELYEAAMKYQLPYSVKVEQVSARIKLDNNCNDFLFSMDTENLNDGILCSTYKTLPTMDDKLVAQMGLAKIIRAVDSTDVARLVIEKHFIRDIKGNLRKFSMQQFRCVDCNKKFRRPPLIGKCDECGGNILFTISKGSITKYLDPAIQLAERFDVSTYLKQSLELTKNRIEEYFGREKEKQIGLRDWV